MIEFEVRLASRFQREALRAGPPATLRVAMRAGEEKVEPLLKEYLRQLT